VSEKEIVLDVISELPDEVSLEQIAEKIEFLAAIQKGMDQLDRGEGIPHEEVKRQLAKWIASCFGSLRLATTCRRQTTDYADFTDVEPKPINRYWQLPTHYWRPNFKTG
jgi:hypothetical protein